MLFVWAGSWTLAFTSSKLSHYLLDYGDFSLLQLTNKIKLKIWQGRSNVDTTAYLYKFYLTQWQRGSLFYFLMYMIIMFKFKVAILKMMHNIASSNINFIFNFLKLTFSLTLTSGILLGTHNNGKRFILSLKSSFSERQVVITDLKVLSFTTYQAIEVRLIKN